MDIDIRREDWPRVTWDAPGPFVLSEDPADHGLSDAEVACIEKAYELRRREVRAALEAPVPYRLGSSLSGIERPQGLKQWAVTVFVLPLVCLVLAIASVVMVPFDYVSHRRKVRHRRAELREELVALERQPLLRPIVQKTLARMWRIYGFERDRFPESVGVELVSAWIDRLYGVETTRAVRLNERLEAVNRARARFRAESPEITCVLWIPRLEQVLQELSTELPPYDWAQSGTAGTTHALH